MSTRVGFTALRANPLRTLLSTLGVVMGVAALVSVLSLGDGMEHFVRAQIDRTSDLQFVQVQPRTTIEIDGQSFARPDVRRFTVADAQAAQRALTVSAEVGLLTRGGALVHSGGSPAPRGAAVLAVTPSVAEFRNLHVAAGRFFSDSETAAGALVVVPQGKWHRFEAPDGVVLMTATPKPTEHLTVDVEDPRTLSEPERAGNSEEKWR